MLGEQNSQSVLFVRWMNQPEGAGSWRGVAAHTLGFAEINDDKAGLTLQNLRCSAQGKGIRITAQVLGGPKTAKRRQMRLDVGPARRNTRSRSRQRSSSGGLQDAQRLHIRAQRVSSASIMR